ncbi:MAG: DUF222 domain-containing protein [Actinomycetota bacterium]
MLIDRVRHAVSTLRSLLADADPDQVDDREAAELFESLAELERLASAGRTIFSRRVETSGLWREQGYRSPAQWVAVRAQSTMGAAIATLETARRLEQLPATREAFQTGSLSAHQAQEIAAAASAAPAAEESLLESARVETVARLREQCRQVIATATHDADADERLHRSRYFRYWTEAEGAVRLDGRLTPDAGARLAAVAEGRARSLRDEARRTGSPERLEAYAADALVSLADATASGPRAVVHVHVDAAAWERGRTEGQEVCRIGGIGPISVSAARRLAADGIVKAVLDDGADVRAVAHLGRTIPARVRTALEARDETCVVPGCEQRHGLEIDHIQPFVTGGPTTIDNLARLCRYHHAQKTHRGWLLDGQPGAWRWFRPKRSVGRSPPRSA